MKPVTDDPPEIHNSLWKDFRGAVGWDVGANRGQSVSHMLRHFDQVYAFEPDEGCWYDLNLLDGHVTWLPIALSDRDGYMALTVAGQLATSSSVDTLINTRVLPAPDFMKVDTGGHELRVLFGARQTLAICRPDLLIEFRSRQMYTTCLALLEQYAYQCETIRHPHYRPGTSLWFNHGWIRARQ